ncbi:MAG: type 4a pilus biogenesis protein PilO [Candidatus Omnitrophica bacterium]|nr:type 4a pilus biogenesis protein PilO [Candidatus Omnitrophota bacterium]MBU1853395.1 type 4a pilus biogenesis protein PilO [Candidatus Omnitrophota bacterium]
MDVQEKQKLILLLGIFGIAALLVYYNLLLKPKFSGFIVYNREYISAKRSIKAAETLIANEDRIRRDYDNLKKQVDMLDGSFANQDDISSLLQDFSRIAESSGVKILKIKPLEVLDNISQDDAAHRFYSEFPILIEAIAGYHQCGEFVNKLEIMDRFIKIDDLDIKAGSGDPRHYIKLKVSTYIVY